jgi:hypothetical protein
MRALYDIHDRRRVRSIDHVDPANLPGDEVVDRRVFGDHHVAARSACGAKKRQSGAIKRFRSSVHHRTYHGECDPTRIEAAAIPDQNPPTNRGSLNCRV